MREITIRQGHVPRPDVGGQPCIQFAQFAPDGGGKLMRVAIRAHHNIRLTHWRLRRGEKYRWLLILRNAQIFSIFDDTNNLDARSILEREVSADDIGSRAKQAGRKISIYYGDGRRIFVVMPIEVSACEYRSTRRFEVFRRYVIPVGRGEDIRCRPTFGFLLEDIYPASGGVHYYNGGY